MTSVPTNITIYRGDTKDWSLTIMDDDGRVDLTDWTIRLTVKENKSDADINAIIQKEGVNVTATDGTATVSLIKADTVDLEIKDYYYDIQIDNTTTSKVHTIRAGIFTVAEDITITSLA